MKYLIASIFSLLLFTGCGVSNADQTPSRDLAALKAKVQIELPVSSATWEVFGTPEYKGGVPGPTDLQTLVAELVLVDSDFKSHVNLPIAGDFFVAPESPRSWLSPEFRKMMDRVRNSTEDMGRLFGCFRYDATLVGSGRAVNGFLCLSGSRAFLYLTLDRR